MNFKIVFVTSVCGVVHLNWVMLRSGANICKLVSVTSPVVIAKATGYSSLSSSWTAHYNI